MALEILVISREIIKPSSPTPHHLRNHRLSIIDQYTPPNKVCCLFFYQYVPLSFEPLNILKSSLSETLSDFYPLAGRISDNNSIDCNDEGVNFFETSVIGRKLDQVVGDALGEEMEQLLPKDAGFDALGPKVLLSIQLNKFDCGGMALGICIGHKASDGSTRSLFLQNWAATARGDRGKIIHPKYDASSIFPGKEGVKTLEFPTGKLGQKVVTRRFVFGASTIAALKAKCTSCRNVKYPSRVEVVIAAIWKSAMNAKRMTSAEVKPKSEANIAVNMRGRLIPPLSNQYVGNMVLAAKAVSGTEDAELDCLVDTIHAAIANVDGELFKVLPQIDPESFKPAEEMEFYLFTSWCKFRFYETDFGWGKPSWMSCAGLTTHSTVLMDTKDGEGVEAWVALNEHEMAKFAAEPYITTFTSKGANSP